MAPLRPAVGGPTKKGTLSLTLELDVRRMTRAEAGETGPVPFLDEYTPSEIADLVAYAIDGEDAQAEMFAGSMIFVKIGKVTVKGAAWVGGSGALLACPFCGSADIDPEGWASTERAGPACQDCGASADTIERWNTRPLAKASAQ